jgi:DNA-binding CsgD family transcriptional regulator
VAARDTAAASLFPDLPALAVTGLAHADASALLDSAITGTLDPRVRDHVLDESRGNPLALLELPRGLLGEPSLVGEPAAATTPPVARLERGYLRLLRPLPPRSRQLLLVAAAEPLGDARLLRLAAERLGIGAEAATAAEEAGLIEQGGRIRFRHPLLRSTVYRSATPPERRQVHRVLADVTDADADPDRRAWHRARAAAGPDDGVAAELERSADRALARGGLPAAAAILERAAALTADPAVRARRSLDAARAKVRVGALDDAATLVRATAAAGTLPDGEQARIDRLRAEIVLAAHRGGEALPVLLSAARRLERLDPRLARDTYLDALSAALFAGHVATRQVAEAVRQAPAVPGRDGTLLGALATLATDGYAAAAPLLHRAVAAFVPGDPVAEAALRPTWLAAAVAASLWDDAAWETLTRRHLEAVRAVGAAGALPLALGARAVLHLLTGDVTAATTLVEESRSLTEAAEGAALPYGEEVLAALRGTAGHAEFLVGRVNADAAARGERGSGAVAQWATAVLCNGLGRYADALRAAREATAVPQVLAPSTWALGELVEAGARTGETSVAAAALEELSARARASGTDWALGVEAGRRALLRSGPAAEVLHRESIDRLAGTTAAVDLARARLLYGEWLRREGRRGDARTPLRSAHEALTAMGLEAFAERARRELAATGETVRRRTGTGSGDLTDQEAQIVRLAAQGLTNPEIGAALFLSPRTVEWHLGKVFPKLGVRTRRDLRRVVPIAVRTGS